MRDVLAGVSLASINIPQVLGYARIAGMPVVTGLYTLLLPLVAFAVFGSSRHLVVAADSATAAIFSSSLSRMAVPASEHYMALVSMVALLTAGLLLVARIFKLGFLADFLSRTVLVGFLTGVGFQVGIAMLSDMFGVTAGSRYSLVQVWQICSSLPHLNTSDAGAVACSWRAAFCSATASRRDCPCRCSPCSVPSRRVPPSTSPRGASQSSVRSPADCPRSGCPMSPGAKSWRCCRCPLPAS